MNTSDREGIRDSSSSAGKKATLPGTVLTHSAHISHHLSWVLSLFHSFTYSFIHSSVFRKAEDCYHGGKPKLHYFNGRGRMECIRWLLAAAGVEAGFISVRHKLTVSNNFSHRKLGDFLNDLLFFIKENLSAIKR